MYTFLGVEKNHYSQVTFSPGSRGQDVTQSQNHTNDVSVNLGLEWEGPPRVTSPGLRRGPPETARQRGIDNLPIK